MSFDFSVAVVEGPDGSPERTLLDMLKNYLGIAEDDNSQDQNLAFAINNAGTIIENWLDRVLGKREVHEFYSHHFGTVVLHNLPVDVAGVEVSINGVVDTQYEIYLAYGKLAHLSRIGFRHDVPLDWRKYDNVVIRYTAGYDPLPLDIASGIVIFAAQIYATDGTGQPPSGGGSGAIKSLQLYDVGMINYDVGSSEGGSSSVSPLTGYIPQSVAQQLSKYMRLYV